MLVQIKGLFTLREQRIIVNMARTLLAQGLPPNDLELLHRAFDALHRTTGLEGRLVDRGVPGVLRNNSIRIPTLDSAVPSCDNR